MYVSFQTLRVCRAGYSAGLGERGWYTYVSPPFYRMKKEQQEIDIKKIIYSHSDILSIKDEIIISNRFDVSEQGFTKLDKIVLDIIEYYEKEKK